VKRGDFYEDIITLQNGKAFQKYIIPTNTVVFHLCGTVKREYEDLRL
jgi:hypothetical protein